MGEGATVRCVCLTRAENCHFMLWLGCSRDAPLGASGSNQVSGSFNISILTCSLVDSAAIGQQKRKSLHGGARYGPNCLFDDAVKFPFIAVT